MATAFFRTMRSLERDGTRRRWPSLLLAVIVLSGWGIWLVQAKVAVYASTSNGRLEVSELVNPVAARDTGCIRELHVELGRKVEKSDVLVVLDSTIEQKKLDEATARLSGLGPRIAALREQLQAETLVRAWQSKTNSVDLDHARIEQSRAESRAANQEQLLAIKEHLRAQDLTTALDTLNAKDQAAERRLEADGARVDVDKLRLSHRYDDEREHSRIASLQRDLAEIEGEERSTQAEIETMRATLELRTVRAPASGVLGNIAALQVGAVVHAGDVIATVVPSEDVHVVANFVPADAVGRILPGQPARVRLDGFAWTQYGLLHAAVLQVANEPRDGTIRVELALKPTPEQSIPVQHGLVGSVEIEVEQLAPWRLLLRAAGYVATNQESSPAGPATLPAGPHGEARL